MVQLLAVEVCDVYYRVRRDIGDTFNLAIWQLSTKSLIMLRARSNERNDVNAKLNVRQYLILPDFGQNRQIFCTKYFCVYGNCVSFMSVNFMPLVNVQLYLPSSIRKISLQQSFIFLIRKISLTTQRTETYLR